MRREKARCARGIIIHPAYYPYIYTGTIDEPTPNAGLLGSPLPRVRRDGNLAESFAIYDGVKRTAAPPACTYFGLYASKMNSVIRRSVPRQ